MDEPVVHLNFHGGIKNILTFTASQSERNAEERTLNTFFPERFSFIFRQIYIST